MEYDLIGLAVAYSVYVNALPSGLWSWLIGGQMGGYSLNHFKSGKLVAQLSV